MKRAARPSRRAAAAALPNRPRRASHGGSSKADLIDEVDELTKAFRRAFARFLRDSADAIDAPCFYFLQTNGWKSLLDVMTLMPLDFSAMIVGCKLIVVERNTDARGIEAGHPK